MKIKKMLIIAAAAGIIAAALPVFVAICGAAAGKKEVQIPLGSTVTAQDGSVIASLSRINADTDGSAARYLAVEKSSYSTWFSCFFGKGGSAAEQLAYIINPNCSAIECIAIANYLESS